MDCRSVKDFLAEHWMDARLPSEIESHLEGCDVCCQEMESISTAALRLDDLKEPVESPEPSESFFWAVHAEIRERQRSPRYRLRRNWLNISRRISSPAPSWAWVGVAALFIVAVTGVIPSLVSHSVQEPPAMPIAASPAPEKPVITEDMRLNKAISLKRTSISLEELFKEVSERTGVPLRPSREISDVRVSVLMPSGTLREMMGQLSRLLGGVWTRRGAMPEPKYTLALQLKTRQEAERLSVEERETARQALAGRLDEAIGDLLQMAPAEVEAAAQDESLPEWQRFNASSFQETRHGALTQVLAGLPTPALDSLAEYDAASISVKSLTEESQEAFQKAFRPEEAANAAQTPPRIAYRLEPEGSDLTAVNASVEGSSPMAEETILKCRVIRPSLPANTVQAAPGRTIAFEEALAVLSGRFKLNIVSDAFENRNLPDLKWESASLKEAIAGLKTAGNQVVQEGGTLRIRSKAWYRDRAREIPERVMQTVEKFLDEGTLPTAEDYARWATDLDAYQLDSIARMISPDAPPGAFATLYRPLRLMGTLARQKEKAASEGIAVSSMTPSQQQIFYDFADQERPAASADDLHHARFAYRIEGGKILFEITYQEQDREAYALTLPGEAKSE
ncbi:MAG: hypothetical protein IT210_00850 [Armatimonadetes bacterium]|nr:hypothetical protein [Armatimonadota bacterium]